MKAALEKGGSELEFQSPCLTLSANLFDEFRIISQEDAWKTWIDDKVKKLFFFIPCIFRISKGLHKEQAP